VRSLFGNDRAVALAAPEDARLDVLRDGLMRIGMDRVGGSTNANAAAIRPWRKSGNGPRLPFRSRSRAAARAEEIVVNGEAPVARTVSADPAELRLANGGAASVVRWSIRAIQPAEPGFRRRRSAKGFVLTRQSFRVRAGAPPERLAPDADGAIPASMSRRRRGDGGTGHPEDPHARRHRAALAAGLDPLNPNLATRPRRQPHQPDRRWRRPGVVRRRSRFYAYDRLPKGNYRFVFRTRALIAGTF